MRTTWTSLIVLGAVAGMACGGVDPSGEANGAANGGGGGANAGGGGGSPDGGGPTGSPIKGGGDDASANGGRGGGDDAGLGGGGDDGGSAGDSGACYAESYSPNANIDDLKNAYQTSAWLAPSIEVMNRRYPTGHFVLNAEQGDSQLTGFADPSSWANLMESMMTMVHEESHGWDFDNSPSAATHSYVLREDLIIAPPQLANMWPRSEIQPELTDDSTSGYDSTYLTGTQGTYDVVFLGEELNAYINGLAATAAVADQIESTFSARDGVPAMLYYLEIYLRVGRTNHAADYATLKASADWQKFVRYEWARGYFWDAQAAGNPKLTIAADAIWAHVNDPTNLSEIQQFTGRDPADIECHPE